MKAADPFLLLAAAGAAPFETLQKIFVTRVVSGNPKGGE
jgi:hypothetical protein